MIGTKNDSEKTPLSLLPFDALWAIGRVLQHGAVKYGKNNWRRGFEWSRLESAILRHYAAYQAGEDIDLESGLLHTAHIACNSLFLLAHQLRGIGLDDRCRDT